MSSENSHDRYGSLFSLSVMNAVVAHRIVLCLKVPTFMEFIVYQ